MNTGRDRRRVGVGLVAALLTALLAACSSGGPGAAASSSSGKPANGPTIVIKNYRYMVPTGVLPGHKVVVRNEDGVAHTVTASGRGGFDAKVGANATTIFTAPTQPGRYRFTCSYHPYMHGVLVVRQ